MELPDKPESPDSTPLTADQFTAWQIMRGLLENQSEADRRYNSLPGSMLGTIISTDLARFLDDRYAQTPKDEFRDIKPGWGLAYWYAQDRLKRELCRRSGRETVQFMAGGWAAGKTHALENHPRRDLAWDGTLRNTEWASEMIDLALSEGWLVEIAYVYRDIELAFYGAVERGRKEGRMVPLNELPVTHREVQKSILDLAALYSADFRVSFLRLHNLGTKDVVCEPLDIDKKALEAFGALHYTTAYEHYYVQAASKISQSKPS